MKSISSIGINAVKRQSIYQETKCTSTVREPCLQIAIGITRPVLENLNVQNRFVISSGIGWLCGLKTDYRGLMGASIALQIAQFG